LLRILTTEGRSVCLCWAKSKPKGPKGFDQKKSPGEKNVSAYAGSSKNLEDLKKPCCKAWTGELIRSISRNSNRNLEYRERRCGFNTKHQSTTKPQSTSNASGTLHREGRNKKGDGRKRGGGSARPPRSRQEKKKQSRPPSFGVLGNSSVAYFVTQNAVREPRCRFKTKHRSTTRGVRRPKGPEGRPFHSLPHNIMWTGLCLDVPSSRRGQNNSFLELSFSEGGQATFDEWATDLHKECHKGLQQQTEVHYVPLLEWRIPFEGALLRCTCKGNSPFSNRG